MQVKLFAINGKQNNIFSETQIVDMTKIVSKNNFKLFDNCSHYLFVDQQNEFVDTIVKRIR